MLFVDMDGTLARFYEPEDALSRYRTDREFFLKLKPYEGLAEVIRRLRAEERGVIILSSVDEDIRECCVEQKERWLRRVFGADIPYAFYPSTGTSKASFIRQRFGVLDRDMWLLDDYTRNLREWAEGGGSAIKARNEINARGGKWKGPGVCVTGEAETLYRELSALLQDQK